MSTHQGAQGLKTAEVTLPPRPCHSTTKSRLRTRATIGVGSAYSSKYTPDRRGPSSQELRNIHRNPFVFNFRFVLCFGHGILPRVKGTIFLASFLWSNVKSSYGETSQSNIDAPQHMPQHACSLNKQTTILPKTFIIAAGLALHSR